MTLQIIKGKIYRSSILTLISIFMAVVPVLGDELLNFIESGDPISYKTALTLTVGVIIPWLLNTLKKGYDYFSIDEDVA